MIYGFVILHAYPIWLLLKQKTNPTNSQFNWCNAKLVKTVIFLPNLAEFWKNCTRREKLVLFFCSAENLVLDSPLNINFQPCLWPSGSTAHSCGIEIRIPWLTRIMERESFPTGRIVNIPATPLWCWDYGFTNFSSTMAPLPTNSPFDHIR